MLLEVGGGGGAGGGGKKIKKRGGEKKRRGGGGVDPSANYAKEVLSFFKKFHSKFYSPAKFKKHNLQQLYCGTLIKNCKCCKIFKVCLTILGHYVLKAEEN